jgi:hypothetical protein
MLRVSSQYGMNSTATWMCHVLGPHMSLFIKVRSSINANAKVQYHVRRLNTNVFGFNFIGLLIFNCVAIDAVSLSSSGLPLAADCWACISVAVLLEMSLTANAAVAVTPVTNDDDHPCDGHDVNSPSLSISSNNNTSNADAVATITAAAAADNEDDKQ